MSLQYFYSTAVTNSELDYSQHSFFTLFYYFATENKLQVE